MNRLLHPPRLPSLHGWALALVLLAAAGCTVHQPDTTAQPANLLPKVGPTEFRPLEAFNVIQDKAEFKLPRKHGD